MRLGRWRWALVFAPAIALILVLSAWAAWPVVFGQTILLATAPVDPPDPLRGDYVDLNLAINRIDGAYGYRQGDTMYVLLERGPETEPATGVAYWRIVGQSREEPERRPGQVCLKGNVEWTNASDARVRYGIESYFIGKDEDLREWQGKTVSVEAKVHGCTGRVTAIHLDGLRWDG